MNHTTYFTNSHTKVPSEYVPVKKRNKITERVGEHKQQKKIRKVNQRIKTQLHRLPANDSLTILFLYYAVKAQLINTDHLKVRRNKSKNVCTA
jgi:hypothetical protein